MRVRFGSLKKRKDLVRLAVAVALVPAMLVQQSFAWGHDGHQMINRAAGESLPKDAPEFLRSKAALDALDFYGPIPDRQWRSNAEPELNAAESPEHFVNLEYADLLEQPLPRRRYDFIRLLAETQAAHPEVKMTPPGVGMLPYGVSEYYEKLEAAMHDYRGLLEEKADTRAVEAEIVYVAGVLGHFVADGSNPMHASIEYNGWVGPNPHGYTTDHHVHVLFESDFVHANVKAADFTGLVPAKPVVLEDVFADYMKYLRHSNSLVEKTYALEKAGGFTGAGTAESRAFVDERLAAGATELRDMIYTAWVKSAAPVKPYVGN